jgi:hypothetical protein
MSTTRNGTSTALSLSGTQFGIGTLSADCRYRSRCLFEATLSIGAQVRATRTMPLLPRRAQRTPARGSGHSWGACDIARWAPGSTARRGRRSPGVQLSATSYSFRRHIFTEHYVILVKSMRKVASTLYLHIRVSFSKSVMCTTIHFKISLFIGFKEKLFVKGGFISGIIIPPYCTS